MNNIPVKDRTDVVKNRDSAAVLAADYGQYKAYLERRKKEDALTKRMDAIEDKVDSIHDMLASIMSKLG